MLQVQNIEKYYGSQNQVTKALDRVSFTVEDGAFIAIMGAAERPRCSTASPPLTPSAPGTSCWMDRALPSSPPVSWPSFAGNGWGLSFRIATFWTP